MLFISACDTGRDRAAETGAAPTDTVNYDFAPVGDAIVTINFTGTAPEWGYLAVALHHASDQQCEVHHGQRGAEGAEFEFAGEIVCRAR
ncbi:MAG: hypothetical protein H0X65_12865 [Gemmatimonadetes bacterium]|nr:hypothetical protein [Gemmatimonadota bacterium]